MTLRIHNYLPKKNESIYPFIHIYKWTLLAALLIDKTADNPNVHQWDGQTEQKKKKKEGIKYVHATAWINCKIIMLSERCQKNNTYCKITFI